MDSKTHLLLKIPGLSVLLRRYFPLTYSNILGVKFGRNCKLINPKYGSEPYLITIGDNVTLSNVSFITHDGSCRLFRDKYPNFDIIKPIKIGSNVFIGYGTILMPGSKISDNSIVGAGSLVIGVIESESVYAGRPAKRISSIKEWLVKNKKFDCQTKCLTPNKKKKFLLNKFKL